MYIDDCKHSFEELSSQVLPTYMKQLEKALANRRPAKDFAVAGQGRAAIARMLGLETDFSGCYVFVDGEEPIYVGISRGVLTRIRQHLPGTTHFDASLAYAMARRTSGTKGSRKSLMERAAFQTVFNERRDYLRRLDVAYIGIVNPVELYVFEAYAALSLRTHEWNTFRTH